MDYSTERIDSPRLVFEHASEARLSPGAAARTPMTLAATSTQSLGEIANKEMSSGIGDMVLYHGPDSRDTL